MSGPWANARTDVVELEQGDHASPYNVDIFIRYIEYAEDTLGAEVGPLYEINDFHLIVKLWLFADFIQGNILANTVMEEIANQADGLDSMRTSEEALLFWWNETHDHPSFANLRGWANMRERAVLRS